MKEEPGVYWPFVPRLVKPEVDNVRRKLKTDISGAMNVFLLCEM